MDSKKIKEIRRRRQEIDRKIDQLHKQRQALQVVCDHDETEPVVKAPAYRHCTICDLTSNEIRG